jgi:hypothetical protein
MVKSTLRRGHEDPEKLQTYSFFTLIIVQGWVVITMPQLFYHQK